MKNIKYLIAITMVFSLIIGCTDDEKAIDFDAVNNSGQPFAMETSASGLASINKIDITPEILSGFSKSYDINSRQDGKDVTKVEVFVSFIGVNTSVDDMLYQSISSDQFNTDGDFPSFSVDYVWADVLSLLGLTLADLEGGDNFYFRLALTNSEGTWSDVSAAFNSQSADNTFIAPVVCLIAPEPGDWTLEMTDLYGDGWNGGQITVNIDGEVTTYAANGSGGTETINIPTGTAIFTFTYSSGDWEGENLYTLTDPNGMVVLDEGEGDWSFDNGPTTGELLNACP